MARVLLENVNKVFDGKVVAVSGFTLGVADGEFMVIVGPSGSGKTTTLRMIAGLEEPTSGNIYIADTLVNNVPPRDRDIAMVFQNYALYPHMTVFENMAFALKMRKFPKFKISKQVEDAARLLGIERVMNRKPKTLSGGQRQRVAVGKAIVRNPSVFLFDEPFSNLDAKLRLTIRAELKALHRKLQATSIYVTHDQAEAMTLGDRICIVRSGMIQQVASSMEIYERPKNKFVAGFFGVPSMNFFDGVIQYKNEKCYFISSNNAILLTSRLKNALANYKYQRVVFGIRPEHVSLQPITGKAENTITCTVTVVELLGDRIDVHLKSSSNDKLIAEVAPHSDIRAGQTISVHINVEKSHIFELGETGKNITMVP
jgi:multiple sugar transport system ATP-binding protein